MWRAQKYSELGVPIAFMSQGRMSSQVLSRPGKIDKIRGDGHCLFRAISKEVALSEDHHQNFRRKAVDVIRNQKYKSFFEDALGMGIEDYLLKSAMESFGWGTDIAIIAFATLLNTPIAVFYTPVKGKERKWNFYRPLTGSIGSSGSKFGEMVDQPTIYLDNPGIRYQRLRGLKAALAT